MDTELVVARYNEDLIWLSKVNNKKITIYNKGNNINYNNIKLPNIGRESHTYLTHIIKNYDNLADITIFTQGDPFFHSPDFLNLIEKPELFEPIQPLSTYYSPSFNNASNNNKKIILEKGFLKKGIPPKSVVNKTQNLWINNNKVYVEYFDNDGVTFYPDYYYSEFIYKFINEIQKIFKFKSYIKFIKDRYKLTNINRSLLQPMCYAGLFAVSKKVIKSRKIDFYKNILNLLLEDYEKYNIDSGLLLERLWLIIFNYQKYNKHYKKLYVKNYEIKNINLPINNNIINFNIKNVRDNELYLILIIDNNEYELIISNSRIYLKNKKDIFKKYIPIKNNFFNNDKYINIIIKLLNKKLNIYVNNKIYLDIFFDKNTIKTAKIEMLPFYDIET
jgi:hypothetical protein